ncbi:MAG TPA: hypothetical protein VGJ24_00115 [Nocardioides sp.]|jgi:hypothetical protein
MIGNASTGVVVLNYGHPGDTWTCLDSLEMSRELDLEIVVVDNAPEGADHDRPREGVGRRAEVVASGANLGYAGGNNLGIARLLDRGVDDVLVLNPTPDRAALADPPSARARQPSEVWRRRSEPPGDAGHPRCRGEPGGLLFRLGPASQRAGHQDPQVREARTAGEVEQSVEPVAGRDPPEREHHALVQRHPRADPRAPAPLTQSGLRDDEIQVWMVPPTSPSSLLAQVELRGVPAGGVFDLPVVAPRTGALVEREADPHVRLFDEDDFEGVLSAAVSDLVADGDGAAVARASAERAARSRPVGEVAARFADAVAPLLSFTQS